MIFCCYTNVHFIRVRSSPFLVIGLIRSERWRLFRFHNRSPLTSAHCLSDSPEELWRNSKTFERENNLKHTIVLFADLRCSVHDIILQVTHYTFFQRGQQVVLCIYTVLCSSLRALFANWTKRFEECCSNFITALCLKLMFNQDKCSSESKIINTKNWERVLKSVEKISNQSTVAIFNCV